MVPQVAPIVHTSITLYHPASAARQARRASDRKRRADRHQLSRTLPFLEAYRRFGHRPGQFPNAHRNQGRILSLPMFAEITLPQQNTVVDLIRAFR